MAVNFGKSVRQISRPHKKLQITDIGEKAAELEWG